MSTSSVLRAFGAVVLLAAVATAAAEDGDRLDSIRERGQITVAVYRDFPPYSYADARGRYTGVDVDLAAALARKLGVRLDLRPFAADENMDDDLRNQVWKGHYLGGGVADLMLHAGVDPRYAARQDKVALFNAYHRETVVVIYREGALPAAPDSPLMLAGLRVGVEIDSISDYYLSGAFNGRLRTAAVRSTSVAEAVAAYLRGDVDAVMAPRGELEGALSAQGASAARFELNEFTGLFRTAWDVGMAVKAGNPALQAALTRALAELEHEGTLAELFARHGLSRSAPAVLASR